MELLLRHKLLIGGATLALAATGGAAYAATQSDATGQQAFIGDVAKRLHVSPSQLTSAVKAALIDRINAEVKAGRLTQAEANKIEQQITQSPRLPFLFAPGAHRFLEVRGKPGGVFHAAASYLGMNTSQLLSDLQSGQSLAQIAKAHGKSVSGLEQAIVTAIKTRLDRAVSKGVITSAQEQQLLSRLSAKISRLVNRTGIGLPAGPPRMEVAPGGMAQTAPVPAPQGGPGGGPFGPPPGPGVPGPNA
jgi:transposase-like protein